MAKRDYESTVEELITPIVSQNKFELVDVEWIKEGSMWYLRVYIDKEGGITIDDCEVVSRAFSEILDTKDFISENYIFEVSSPGLDRPLKKDKDFERSMGQPVEVKLYKAVDKQKEFTGYLADYNDQQVMIELEDETMMTFDRADIAIIRLAIYM